MLCDLSGPLQSFTSLAHIALVDINSCGVLQDTREGMLAWLAGALEANGERNKLQMNARAAASHSFFVSPHWH